MKVKIVPQVKLEVTFVNGVTEKYDSIEQLIERAQGWVKQCMEHIAHHEKGIIKQQKMLEEAQIELKAALEYKRKQNE